MKNKREKVRDWAYSKRGRRTALAAEMGVHTDTVNEILNGAYDLSDTEYANFCELIKKIEAIEKSKELKPVTAFKRRNIIAEWLNNRCLRVNRLSKELNLKLTNTHIKLLARNFRKDIQDSEWLDYQAAMQRVEAIEDHEDFLGMLVCMWLWDDENRRMSYRFIPQNNLLVGFRGSANGKHKNLCFHRDWNEIIDVMHKVKAYKQGTPHKYKKAG